MRKKIGEREVCLIGIIGAIILGAVCAFIALFFTFCANAKADQSTAQEMSIAESDSALSVPQETSSQNQTEQTNSEEIFAEIVPVSGISLSTYEVSLVVGQNQMPIVTMSPDNASDKGEIWTSSNESVATVNDMGLITGVSEGNCVVTVTSVSNPQVSTQVQVSVTEPAQSAAEEPVSTAVSIESTKVKDEQAPAPAVTETWGTPQHKGENQVYGTVRCDAAGINAPLVWGYGRLDDNSIVCQGADTNIFGTDGVKILASHNNGIFANLQNVSKGDRFVIQTDYGNYIYEVIACDIGTMQQDGWNGNLPTGNIFRDDGSYIIEFGSSENILYAYTCYPFGSTGDTNKRFVVTAIPVS